VTESEFVGAWDAGPFDNDDAADFAAELDDADPNQRILLLRDAMQAAADIDDVIDEDIYLRALAAAAVVAASRVDTVGDSGYAPKFLAGDDDFAVPDDLIELAVLVLDRLAEGNDEYAEFFDEAGTLESLRSALTT
jgi:uncharacterized protein DUF4259